VLLKGKLEKAGRMNELRRFKSELMCWCGHSCYSNGSKKKAKASIRSCRFWPGIMLLKGRLALPWENLVASDWRLYIAAHFPKRLELGRDFLSLKVKYHVPPLIFQNSFSSKSRKSWRKFCCFWSKIMQQHYSPSTHQFPRMIYWETRIPKSSSKNYNTS